MSNITGSVDSIDLLLMQMCDKGNSVREMGQAVGRGVSTVHGRLGKLKDLGLVKGPPMAGMHRLYRTTDLGRGYLLAQGFTAPDLGPNSN